MTGITEEGMNMSDIMSNPSSLLTFFIDFLKDFGPKLIGAILIIWIGFKIIKFINKIVVKAFKKAKLDPMVESFAISLLSICLKVLVIISAAGVIGIQTTSFVALIAAAGIAFGMALSGTLGNFASGVIILIFKPYKIGDYIETAGNSGTVKEIHIFNTVLLTPDKKTVIIPNAQITSNSMINHSTEPIRRLDLNIGISYSDDIDLAKNTLKELADKEKRITEPKNITIAVSELGDSAVIISFKMFVKGADYFTVKSDMLENIKKSFDKKGLNFPFPQQDLHIIK